MFAKTFLKEKPAILVLVLCLFSCASNKEDKTISNSPKKLNLTVLPQKKITVIGPLEKSLSEQGLIDVQTVDSTLMVDLKYSTEDNFFKRDVYESLEKAFLPLSVAKKLSSANTALASNSPNLRLVVFDAVRPLSIQQILWDALDSIPENVRKAYVADPEVGSLHNYGCAVDLSIFDLKTDSLLDMGTKYDYFGYLAYPRKEQEMLENGLLNSEQIANRSLLRSIMTSAGFTPINSEWWHFNSTSLLNAKRDFMVIK